MRPVTARRVALALLILAAALPMAAAGADIVAKAVSAATEEAMHWLEQLDARRYAESWNDAAAVMKEGRSQDDWVRDIGGPRELLGKSLIRELQHADYSTTVRGNAPPAIETVLVMLEEDRWRIAGYNIARAPEPAPSKAPAKTDAGPEPKPKE